MLHITDNPKNEFYIKENKDLLITSLKYSKVYLTPKNKSHNYKLVYSAKLYEPEVTYNTVSKAKYRLNYVPGQTKKYNIDMSSYYGYSQLYPYRTNITATETTPGRLESQYAGQETKTFRIESYKKELTLKLYKKNELLLEVSLSMVDSSPNIRENQKFLVYALGLIDITKNKSSSLNIAIGNTFLLEALGYTIPSVN